MEDRELASFFEQAKDIKTGGGWRYAPGLTDAELDAWERRLPIVFPPEVRVLLGVGFPVRAPAEELRSIGPMTTAEGKKTVLRVRGRHLHIPTWLARRRPLREATFMHYGLIDWAATSSENVAWVQELAVDRQRELLQFHITHNGYWPEQWGERPDDHGELAHVIAARMPEAPSFVPLDSRTSTVSSSERGLPVFMYWFGEELHLHAFDLAAGVGRDASLLPPRIDVSPTWTFWSQFASLTFSGAPSEPG